MGTVRFSILILSASIFMLSRPLGCQAQKDNPETKTDSLGDSTEVTAPSDQELEESLKRAGTDIADMILEKDAIGLLKYVEKSDESVSYFPDVYKSYEQVEADLSDTTSVKYCQIFNMQCYSRSDLPTSVYEFLREGKMKDMEVSVEILNEATRPDFIYGIVRYKWEGMPEAYKKEPLSTNYFILTKDGWKFDTFFSWY